jgi:hypothetical protein
MHVITLKKFTKVSRKSVKKEIKFNRTNKKSLIGII